MLSDILLVILGLYAISTPLWMMKAVKFGAKCGQTPEKIPEEPIFNVPKPKKEVEIPAEMQRDLDILENLAIFDGTPNGQKEIK